jgi:hypothetical protein
MVMRDCRKIGEYPNLQPAICTGKPFMLARKDCIAIVNRRTLRA